MTMVDAEKLTGLVESFEFGDTETFSKKVKVLKEKYFPEASKPKNEGVETLNEHRLEPTIDTNIGVDPLVAAALKSLNTLR